MGYSYSYDGKLACDDCGAANGETRKVRCTYGYCPSPALCPSCRTNERYHAWRENCRKTCKVESARSKERERLRDYLMDSGQLVRVSAISAPEGSVDVTFVNRTEVVIYRMSSEVYHAIDYRVIAKPADYEAIGAITRVPA